MKTFTLVVIILLLLSIMPVFAEYSGGSGTEAAPWQIACPNDLLYLGSHPADYNSCFILTTDIDLAPYTFTTAVIAPDINSVTDGFQGTAFTGSFDGNDHLIRNLTINANGAGNDYLGLFGRTDSGCQIKNLGIEDVDNVEGGGEGDTFFYGGLVGDNRGTISNCYTTGYVFCFANSGGLVGINYGTINNCHATDEVAGFSDAGGLVGDNYYGTINNCFATGAVRGESGVGGLVGGNQGSINNCYAKGAVDGISAGIGGLVGDNSGGTIQNCYATGKVSDMGTQIFYLGGLVGWNSEGTIQNCYATGAVEVISSFSVFIGGLVGSNPGGTIQNCYATGSVTGGDDLHNLGGLMGYNDGSVSNCYTTGSVTGGDDSYSLGGLVGYNPKGTIQNCYATGSVAGGDDSHNLGGLMGYNDGSVSNCYAIGSVTGGDHSQYLGGLMGYNGLGGIIGNCFWNVETNEFLDGVGNMDPDPAGAIFSFTFEMQIQSTFTDYGWDFVDETANGTEDIWRMPSQTGYPVLNWQSLNFIDYAVFANAWLSTPADANWNPLCDLKPDNIIDALDLQILVEHWLTE